MAKQTLEEEINKLVKEEIEKNKYGRVLSEGMRFHLENGISFYDNIYRVKSKAFFSLMREMKELYTEGKIQLSEQEKELIEQGVGEFAIYENKKVPLGIPMIEGSEMLDEAEYQGKDVELGKPKRGGSKKFYVYQKCGDKVKKISFGSPDMSVKVSDPERRKSFAARHNCEDKNDRCTAGYWSCRIGRYPSLTGASKSYRWW